MDTPNGPLGGVSRVALRGIKLESNNTPARRSSMDSESPLWVWLFG